MFKDRFDAGKQLAEKLMKYKGKKDTIIFGIPRGGLEVGYELAKNLKLPLDIILTKKIGFPGNDEYAIGAVGLGNEYIVDEEVVKSSAISQNYIKEEVKRLSKLIEERYKLFRKNKKFPNIKNKTIIVVDDGIATGNTVKMSIKLLKKQKPKKIILAIPVAPQEAIRMLEKHVDELICLSTPINFFAIGQFYDNFTQVSDKQVIGYLSKAKEFLN